MFKYNQMSRLRHIFSIGSVTGENKSMITKISLVNITLAFYREHKARHQNQPKFITIYVFETFLFVSDLPFLNRREKHCQRSSTQMKLNSHRSWLEARTLGFKVRNGTIFNEKMR